MFRQTHQLWTAVLPADIGALTPGRQKTAQAEEARVDGARVSAGAYPSAVARTLCVGPTVRREG